jgi:hypothetical protein
MWLGAIGQLDLEFILRRFLFFHQRTSNPHIRTHSSLCGFIASDLQFDSSVSSRLAIPYFPLDGGQSSRTHISVFLSPRFPLLIFSSVPRTILIEVFQSFSIYLPSSSLPAFCASGDWLLTTVAYAIMNGLLAAQAPLPPHHFQESHFSPNRSSKSVTHYFSPKPMVEPPGHIIQLTTSKCLQQRHLIEKEKPPYRHLPKMIPCLPLLL